MDLNNAILSYKSYCNEEHRNICDCGFILNKSDNKELPLKKTSKKKNLISENPQVGTKSGILNCFQKSISEKNLLIKQTIDFVKNSHNMVHKTIGIYATDQVRWFCPQDHYVGENIIQLGKDGIKKKDINVIFLPPEQVDGKYHDIIKQEYEKTMEGDMYSLGILIFCLIAERLPYSYHITTLYNEDIREERVYREIIKMKELKVKPFYRNLKCQDFPKYFVELFNNLFCKKSDRWKINDVYDWYKKHEKKLSGLINEECSPIKILMDSFQCETINDEKIEGIIQKLEKCKVIKCDVGRNSLLFGKLLKIKIRIKEIITLGQSFRQIEIDLESLLHEISLEYSRNQHEFIKWCFLICLSDLFMIYEKNIMLNNQTSYFCYSLFSILWDEYGNIDSIAHSRPTPSYQNRYELIEFFKKNAKCFGPTEEVVLGVVISMMAFDNGVVDFCLAKLKECELVIQKNNYLEPLRKTVSVMLLKILDCAGMSEEVKKMLIYIEEKYPLFKQISLNGITKIKYLDHFHYHMFMGEIYYFNKEDKREAHLLKANEIAQCGYKKTNDDPRLKRKYSILIVKSIISIGKMYLNYGKFFKSVDRLGDCLDMSKNIRRVKLNIDIFNFVGMLYAWKSLKEVEANKNVLRAKSYVAFEQSLAYSDACCDNGTARLSGLMNLGTIAIRLNKIEKAESCFVQSINLFILLWNKLESKQVLIKMFNSHYDLFRRVVLFAMFKKDFGLCLRITEFIKLFQVLITMKSKLSSCDQILKIEIPKHLNSVHYFIVEENGDDRVLLRTVVLKGEVIFVDFKRFSVNMFKEWDALYKKVNEVVPIFKIDEMNELTFIEKPNKKKLDKLKEKQKNLLRKFYKLMICGIDKILIRDFEWVFFPHEGLEFIPFHAMINDNGEYFVEEKSNKFSFCPSLFMYLGEKKNQKIKFRMNKQPRIIVGDPVIKERQRDPHSNKELLNVATITKTPKESIGIVIQGDYLIKKTLIDVINKIPPKVIHIASHNDVSKGISLTDGTFNCNDIQLLNLNNVNLTFFNCCSTSVGVVGKGGVENFPLMCLAGGVRNVICTSSSVRSSIACFIASKFYACYLITNDVAYSLKCAVLEIVELYINDYGYLRDLPVLWGMYQVYTSLFSDNKNMFNKMTEESKSICNVRSQVTLLDELEEVRRAGFWVKNTTGVLFVPDLKLIHRFGGVPDKWSRIECELIRMCTNFKLELIFEKVKDNNIIVLLNSDAKCIEFSNFGRSLILHFTKNGFSKLNTGKKDDNIRDIMNVIVKNDGKEFSKNLKFDFNSGLHVVLYMKGVEARVNYTFESQNAKSAFRGNTRTISHHKKLTRLIFDCENLKDPISKNEDLLSENLESEYNARKVLQFS